MAKMLFIGHASLRFTTNSGQVIYVDPYYGDSYGYAADILLVTHQHFDHNAVDKVTKKPDCLVVTEADALKDGKYGRFEKDGVSIQAVPAANKNHAADKCVGYILTMDGISVYCAGDTSKICRWPTLPS
jgi:L-ascorbate metabolism protein UlaG (beta-lactamase superfamily)